MLARPPFATHISALPTLRRQNRVHDHLEHDQIVLGCRQCSPLATLFSLSLSLVPARASSAARLTILGRRLDRLAMHDRIVECAVLERERVLVCRPQDFFAVVAVLRREDCGGDGEAFDVWSGVSLPPQACPGPATIGGKELAQLPESRTHVSYVTLTRLSRKYTSICASKRRTSSMPTS